VKHRLSRPRSARRVLGRSARLAHHVERTARSGARASGASKEEGISPDLLFLLVPEDRVTKNRLHSTCDRATNTPKCSDSSGLVPPRSTSDSLRSARGGLGIPKATSSACCVRSRTKRWRLSRNPRRSVRPSDSPRRCRQRCLQDSSGSSRERTTGAHVSMKRSRPIFIQKESRSARRAPRGRRISRR